MKQQEKVQKINCLSNDMNALYHLAARKLGVSDSALCVLYLIYEKGDHCRLYDICAESGISKQTINSAIRNLEKEEILYLEQDTGRTKRICLTEKGKSYIARTGARLYETENRIFQSWPEEEFELYLKLMEKYNHDLREEIEKM